MNHVGAHLAAALASHARQCRQNGVALPPGWSEVSRMLANQAQTGAEGRDLASSSAARESLYVETQPLLLTRDQVVEQLGLSLTTVKALLRSGELRSVRIGGSVRVRTADLDAYVASLTGPVAGRVETKAPSGPVSVESKPVDPAPCRLDGFDKRGDRAEAGP